MTTLKGQIQQYEFTNDQSDIAHHKTMQRAAWCVYDPLNRPMSDGYVLDGEPIIDNKTGFQACVYKKGNHIIVAFAGTNDYSTDLDDGNNIRIGRDSEQIHAAVRLTREIAQKYPDAKVSYTGHSLGGAIAQFIAAINHREAVTFNPLGAEALITPGDRIDESKIVNYCNPKDKISSLNPYKHLGRCYSIQSKAFTFKKGGTFWKEHHEIETMEDLSFREPVTPYELKNRFEYYSKNKKNIDDPYSFSKRYNQISHNNFFPNNHSSNNCPGSYQVSSYTRDDGTKVEGYIRHCGVHRIV